MNTQDNDFKTNFSSLLAGKDSKIDLTDAIMNRVIVVTEQKKAKYKKEKIIVRIYLGAMAAVLMAMWFVFRNPDISLKFSLNLNAFSMSNAVVLYTRIAILIFILAVISFWVHAIKPKLAI